MHIKQIAIRVPNLYKVKENLEKYLGASFDVNDELDMKGYFMSPYAESSNKDNDSVVKNLSLAFDYNVLNECNELELINTDDETHWHSSYSESHVFLSHLGVYCDTEQELEDIMNKFDGVAVLQDSVSYNHSRKNSDGSSRSYRDVIISTRHLFGFNLKLSYKYEGS